MKGDKSLLNSFAYVDKNKGFYVFHGFGNLRNINQNMFLIKITSNRILNDRHASQVTKG